MKFELTASKINEIIKGELIGSPDLLITNVNRIEHGTIGDLIFCASDDYLPLLKACDASLVIISPKIEYQPKKQQTLIKVDKPYDEFVKILLYLDENFKSKENGIHPSSIIGNSTSLGSNCRIMEFVSIGKDCRIGNNVIIYPNVTIYDDTVIGDNCIIHSGAVIGSDGFGYADMPDGSYLKIPQLGNVVLHDNVEVGANSCIDRAVAGSTIISEGVKIDNLVHIAHNVEIGENSAFAAQVGIAGSAKIGNRVRFGGQSASVGHVKIVDDVTIIAQSGVSKSIDKKGTYFGSPAKPQREAFRIEAVLRNLPELFSQVKVIQQKLED